MANIYNRQWATEKEGKRGKEERREKGDWRGLGRNSEVISLKCSLSQQKMPSSNLRPIDLVPQITPYLQAKFKSSKVDDTFFV